MNARYNSMLPYFFTVLSFVSISASAEPPFGGTIFIDPDIITESDPTTFVSIEAAGQDLRTMYDRRSGWIENNAFLFEANFSDSLSSQVQVNSEFETASAAAIEAEKYAIVIGRLPKALRVDVATYWIHKGVEPFGGGNNNLLIHVGQADLYVADGILEETFVHEAAHTSLDAYHASSAAWLTAQEADGEFISTYAEDNPTREDIAESFLPYLAVEFRADRISEDLAESITNTIPNRIAFFNSLDLDLTPITTTSVDSDADGVVDGEDNCPAIDNADQLNSDSDELGNACDEDDDNDGISDLIEIEQGTNSLDNLSCFLCQINLDSGGIRISGSIYDDTLSGTNQNDELYGYDGNDAVAGLGGDDVIKGGEGDDVISGGSGNDSIFGGAGEDNLSGGSGHDLIYGGLNSDILSGGSGNDTIFGEEDDDIISGGSGDDIISGGDGNDVISGGSGDEEISGGSGSDVIDGGSGWNNVTGGDGTDIFAVTGTVIASVKDTIITDFDSSTDFLASTEVISSISSYRDLSSSMIGGTEIGYGDGRRLFLEGIELADIDLSRFVCMGENRGFANLLAASQTTLDCDLDGDGFLNSIEIMDGTDPIDQFSFSVGRFTFDIDHDEEVTALTDGLLVVRHLFNFEGGPLISGAITDGGGRRSANAVSIYLTNNSTELDIDGDGNAQALTDGLLLIRYLFGFTGNALVSDAIGDGAMRTNAEDIEAYILERMPE